MPKESAFRIHKTTWPQLFCRLRSHDLLSFFCCGVEQKAKHIPRDMWVGFPIPFILVLVNESAWRTTNCKFDCRRRIFVSLLESPFSIQCISGAFVLWPQPTQVERAEQHLATLGRSSTTEKSHYHGLVYTTQVNSAFRAIWWVPQSRDIKYYSLPCGFWFKKMSRETHFIRK